MTTAPRKLATIVALDVAGYSARTEADEAKTTAEVAALRQIIEGIAAAHGGRVFNTAGDGFMLEFGSSLAAVEAASELAAKCEPKVRVGVHLGDVVVQPNGDLLGHGVNVAARLMAKSDPGAALISADVRRTIRGPLAERLVSRGLLQLDKMFETIEAFALGATTTQSSAVVLKSSVPVLAILPFDNLSNDPDMQFLSDGISEEILQVLAHRSGLKVIGRTSAFQFRGAAKADAARNLRATHVLDGALRKSGNRLRVSAQLSEGATGASLWSDRYDRALTEVFELQDDIAAQVASALQSVFTITARPAIDPVAYELSLRAREIALVWTDEAFRQGLALLEEAVRRTPDFADAWAQLGMLRAMLLPRDDDGSETPQHSEAVEALERALRLDPNCAVAYLGLAGALPAFGCYARKLQLAETGFRLAPGTVAAHTSMSGYLGSVGRFRDAHEHMSRAAQLEPLSPFTRAMAAAGKCFLGQVDEAFADINDAIAHIAPNFFLWFNKWAMIRLTQGIPAALKFLDDEPVKGAAWFEQYEPQLRGSLMMSSMPPEQQRQLLASLVSPSTNKTLSLPLCMRAAELGHADLAFESLFGALQAGRPITAVSVSNVGINRSPMSFILFNPFAKALRADPRFPRLCLKLGLVEYWQETGKWPDCVDEVPYDFKAECEKAVWEVTKA